MMNDSPCIDEVREELTPGQIEEINKANIAIKHRDFSKYTKLDLDTLK